MIKFKFTKVNLKKEFNFLIWDEYLGTDSYILHKDLCKNMKCFNNVRNLEVGKYCLGNKIHSEPPRISNLFEIKDNALVYTISNNIIFDDSKKKLHRLVLESNKIKRYIHFRFYELLKNAERIQEGILKNSFHLMYDDKVMGVISGIRKEKNESN